MAHDCRIIAGEAPHERGIGVLSAYDRTQERFQMTASEAVPWGHPRRRSAGEAWEDAVAQRLVERVPGPLAVYVRAHLAGRGLCDVDLLLLTEGSVFVIGVTSLSVGAFGRDQNMLQGHPGATRQVRQLAQSTSQLAGSALGRAAHLHGVLIRPVLCVAGERTPELVEEPRFDLVTVSDVALARIVTLEAADIVGYVIANVLAAQGPDGSLDVLRRCFERHLLSSCDYVLSKPLEATTWARDASLSTEPPQPA